MSLTAIQNIIARQILDSRGNPTVEGDTTALYLAKLIKPLGIRVTRLAHGMPIGGELDYTDNATLLSALEYRRDL